MSSVELSSIRPCLLSIFFSFSWLASTLGANAPNGGGPWACFPGDSDVLSSTSTAPLMDVDDSSVPHDGRIITLLQRPQRDFVRPASFLSPSLTSVALSRVRASQTRRNQQRPHLALALLKFRNLLLPYHGSHQTSCQGGA